VVYIVQFVLCPSDCPHSAAAVSYRNAIAFVLWSEYDGYDILIFNQLKPGKSVYHKYVLWYYVFSFNWHIITS